MSCTDIEVCLSTVYMYILGHEDIITLFGINGDGLDRATRFTSSSNIHVLCGAIADGVQLDWFFENGTKVGTSNRNVREGHFENGTASLQIASNRRVSPCDAGVYACRANQSATERVEQKTFKLTVGSKFSLLYTLVRHTKHSILEERVEINVCNHC